MEKLKKYLETWLDGKKIKGFEVSLSDIWTMIDIYNDMLDGKKPCFIQSNAKKGIG